MGRDGSLSFPCQRGYYSTVFAKSTPFFLKISRKITDVPKMHRRGPKGVYTPFFCINKRRKLHASCKLVIKMQESFKTGCRKNNAHPVLQDGPCMDEMKRLETAPCGHKTVSACRSVQECTRRAVISFPWDCRLRIRTMRQACRCCRPAFWRRRHGGRGK